MINIESLSSQISRSFSSLPSAVRFNAINGIETIIIHKKNKIIVNFFQWKYKAKPDPRTLKSFIYFIKA